MVLGARSRYVGDDVFVLSAFACTTTHYAMCFEFEWPATTHNEGQRDGDDERGKENQGVRKDKKTIEKEERRGGK